MYQLLLDSSNIFLSVGLAKNGKLVDKISYEAWQRQSEMMVTEVDNILKRNNVDKKELDGVVVGIGPGSYTGVRIGVTIALSLLKHQEFPTICVFNARSGRSYFGVYKGKEVLEKDTVLENEKVLEYIKSHPDYLVFDEMGQADPIDKEVESKDKMSLLEIVEQAGAKAVGAGIAIEKGFQEGGARLRSNGLRVESLAIIDHMDENSITFLE